MAANKKKKTKRNKAKKNSAKQTGRVALKPYWESSWNRASSFSSSFIYLPKLTKDFSLERLDTHSDTPVDHSEVFKVLQSITEDFSTEYSFSTLNLLAEIFSKTEELTDIEKELKELSRLHTSPSEAELFTGYIANSNPPRTHASKNAGRILRLYRDGNLPEVVSLVNANRKVLEENPFITSICLSSILLYEIAREDSDLPVNKSIKNSFFTLDLPPAQPDLLLDLALFAEPIFRKHALTLTTSTQSDEKNLIKCSRLMELLPEYLNLSFYIASEMDRTSPSSALFQCGLSITDSFEFKTSLVALLVSESWFSYSKELNISKFAFKKVFSPSIQLKSGGQLRADAPTDTLFASWCVVLNQCSPNGFSHEKIQDFTPSDFLKLNAGSFLQIPQELRKSFSCPKSFSSSHKSINIDWAKNYASFEERFKWLFIIGPLLNGSIQADEMFTEMGWESLSDFEMWREYGPFGAEICLQNLVFAHFLLQLIDSEDDLDSLSLKTTDINILQTKRDEFLKPLEDNLIAVLSKEIINGMDQEASLRSTSEWMQLLMDILDVVSMEPSDDFKITSEPKSFNSWLSHAAWSFEHRIWKPKKYKPETEIDDLPTAARTENFPDPDNERKNVKPDKIYKPTSEVKIIFAGGDWKLAKHDNSIEKEVKAQYEDLISIEWFHVDHSNSWPKEVSTIANKLADSDALILSPIIRTTMGEHLRKEASKNEIPWIACTGGKTSMSRSIHDAIQVVCKTRENSTVKK